MQSIAHSGPAASAGVASERKMTDKGRVRVPEMVRTDSQSQKIWSFFETAKRESPASAATVALSSVPRKRRLDMQHVPRFHVMDEDGHDQPAQCRRHAHSDVVAKLQGNIEKGREDGAPYDAAG